MAKEERTCCPEPICGALHGHHPLCPRGSAEEKLLQLERYFKRYTKQRGKLDDMHDLVTLWQGKHAMLRHENNALRRKLWKQAKAPLGTKIRSTSGEISVQWIDPSGRGEIMLFRDRSEVEAGLQAAQAMVAALQYALDQIADSDTMVAALQYVRDQIADSGAEDTG